MAATVMALSIGFCACSSDPVTPEIKGIENQDNYFEHSMDYTSEGGQKVLAFSVNVDWTLSMATMQGNSSWCTLSQENGTAGDQKIIVSVSPNTGYEDRNVVITLTAGDLVKTVIVNQKQKDAITLTTNRFEIGNEGGTIDVEVKSNVNYDFRIPEACQNWISMTSSSTRALSKKNISFKIAKSEEYDKREGEIIFSYGSLSEKVKVYQSGSAILVLSKNEYTFGTEGGEMTIDISSNFNYETDFPDVDWIVMKETRAISSHTLVYEVKANETFDNREAVIVFKDANGTKKESVSVKQRQKDAILLSTDRMEIPQEGGTFSVEVNSNVEYAMEIAPSCQGWLRQDQTRSLTSSSLVFYAEGNEEVDKREGEIYFKYNDIVETIKVYQSGGAILVLNQTTYNLPGEATTISVQLKSNIDYSVSVSDEWIKEVSTRAISSSTKNFNILANNSGQSRTGTITFTSMDGSKSSVVTITQATIVKARSLEISFYGTLNAYVGDSYNFSVNCYPDNAVTDYVWKSSDTKILTVSGNGRNATVKIVGYGEAKVIVHEKNSGLSTEYPIHSRVSEFSWNSTGEVYSGIFPMMTIVVGERQKLRYSSRQGSSIPNLFGNLADFVFYEPNYVVDRPSIINIDANGNATALKEGIVGIKPTGYIERASGNNDRLYIKVLKSYSEKEPNNDFPYATEIKSGTPITFDLSSRSDVDCFKFTRQSQYMIIKITYSGNYFNEDEYKRLRVELYDSNYSNVQGNNWMFKDSGDAQQQMRLIISSTSYLKIYTNDPSNTFPTGEFTLEVFPFDI